MKPVCERCRSWRVLILITTIAKLRPLVLANEGYMHRCVRGLRYNNRAFLEYFFNRKAAHELNGGNSVFVDFTHGELGTLLAKVLRGKKHIKAVVVYEQGSVRGLESEDYIWNGGNIIPLEMEGSEAEIKAAIASLFADKDFVAKNNL